MAEKNIQNNSSRPNNTSNSQNGKLNYFNEGARAPKTRPPKPPKK